MHTSVGIPRKPPRRNENQALTAVASNSDPEVEEETQQVAIEEIKLPDKDWEGSCVSAKGDLSISPMAVPGPNDKPGLFRFEKDKLRELGEEVVSRYRLDGPVPEVDQQDPRVGRLALQLKQVREEDEQVIRYWSRLLRALSVSTAVWGVGQVIFSMVMTFVIALNQYVSIAGSTIPLAWNVVVSVWMIYISIKGGSASTVSDPASDLLSRFVKFAVATVAILATQLLVMPLVQSLPDLCAELSDLSLTGDTDDILRRRGNALVALGYMMVWLAVIINLGSMVLSLISAILLRKRMERQDIHVLEQKALPLGYQIYANQVQDELTLPVPYHV